MLVSIGYSACHWCHVMERESFEDERDRAAHERALRLHQGRPRGAPRRRRDLHGRGAGDDRRRRLAAERLPHARRRAVLGRHLLPARAAPGHAELAAGADGDRRARGTSSARRSARRPAAIVERLRGAAALKPPGGRGRPGLARRRGRRPAQALRRRARRLRPRAEVPARLGDRVPARPRRARDGAAHAAPDGERRHLRPDRRRLRALLGRPRLARPALREDALRQRAARARLPARLAGHRRAAVRARVPARRSTGRCASCARRRAAFASALDADSEGVEGKFYVWTLDEVREVLGDELGEEAIAHFGDDRGAATSRARNIPVRATPDPPHRDELRAPALRGARAARLAGPRRQAPDRLERADDLRARRRRRGARRAALPRRRGRAARTSSSPACATRRGACCAPTTAAQARLRAVLEDHAFLLEALLDALRGDVRPALVRRGARARRHDHRALRRPRERRLLLDRRRPRAADRAPQGHRRQPDPGRPVGRRARAAAARRADRRVPLRGGGARRDPAPARDRAAAPGRRSATCCRRSTSTSPPCARSRSSAPTAGRSSASCARAFRPHVVLAGGERRRRAAARRAASRSTAAPPPTCASASPASGRSPSRTSSRRCSTEIQAEPPVPYSCAAMARILTIPAGKRAKFVVAIVFFLVTAVVGGLFSGKFEDAQENETVSFLPGKAESVKSLEAVKQLPGRRAGAGGHRLRAQGRADRRRPPARGRGPAARSPTDRPSIALPPQKPVFSENGDAALFSIADPRHGRLRPLRVRRWTTIRGRVSGEQRRADGQGHRRAPATAPTRSRCSGTSTARCSASPR